MLADNMFFHSIQSCHFHFSLHIHFSGNEKLKLSQNYNGGGKIRLGSIYDYFIRTTTIEKQKRTTFFYFSESFGRGSRKYASEHCQS